MRYFRYAFLAILAVCLISVALANRGVVGLKLLPDGLAQIFGLNHAIELPLFVVIFGGIVAGLLIGFIWEWFREYKIRAEAGRKTREVHKLEREVRRLKGKQTEEQDDVLALLDKAS